MSSQPRTQGLQGIFQNGEDPGEQQAITAADWFTHDSLMNHSYTNFDWFKFNKPIWQMLESSSCCPNAVFKRILLLRIRYPIKFTFSKSRSAEGVLNCHQISFIRNSPKRSSWQRQFMIQVDDQNRSLCLWWLYVVSCTVDIY